LRTGGKAKLVRKLKPLVKTWAWLVPALVWAAGVLAGCASEAAPPVRGVPTEARRVVLFEAYEAAAALGGWDRVVGISRYAYDNDLLRRAVPRLREIPSPGSGFDVNVEALLALKPDLVVSWSRKPESSEYLVRQGIPVMMIYPETLGELYRDLIRLGQVLGQEARAREVTAYMAQSLRALEERLASVPDEDRPRVTWLWGKPTTLNGNRGVVSELLHLAGGHNLGAHLEALNQELSMEAVLSLSPEVVIIWGSAAYTAQDLLRDPKWSTTPAVQSRRVFKATRASTWSPRVVATAWWLGHCFHPQIITDNDWRRAADEIYRYCFGIAFEERP